MHRDHARVMVTEFLVWLAMIDAPIEVLGPARARRCREVTGDPPRGGRLSNRERQAP